MRKISFTYQHRKDGFIFITCYFSSMKYVWLRVSKKFNRLKHKTFIHKGNKALFIDGIVCGSNKKEKKPKEFPFKHS